ncbi:MAG TPA: spore coat protein U domain-containing protein [Ramlibacter sp.]|nr:spore coat protein U domain-containing protein [Ramlibacter sp.]
MKKISLAWLATALLLLSGLASAQSVNAPFTVSVTLTPTCTIKTAASNIAFGTYTAFQSAAIDKTSSVTYQCSSGISPSSIAFNSAASGTTSSTAGTGIATAEGVLNGLRYTLATTAGLGSATTGATAAAAGSGGTGGTNSTGNEWAFSINAQIPGGQGGSGSGAADSHSWNLTLVY